MAKKHPEVLAWEKWKAEHASTFELGTIGTDPKYLENRLWAAFMAGHAAAEDQAIKLRAAIVEAINGLHAEDPHVLVNLEKALADLPE